MAAKAPMAAPIPYATPWTGFWISGGFGYGLADIEHSVRSPVAPFAAFDAGHDNGARGWLGKGGIGYDFQMSSWVIGAFADATFSDIAGTSNFNCPGACIGPTGFSGRFKNDWSWAVGGRIGYVALPGLLTYVNGGWTEANFTGTKFLDASNGFAPGLSLPSQRRDGWFLGGGTEYAFNFLPGLFLKSEYRFADFDNHDSNVICTGVLAGCAAGAIASIDRSRVFVQTITTELVYRFNWSGVGAGGGGRFGSDLETPEHSGAPACPGLFCECGHFVLSRHTLLHLDIIRASRRPQALGCSCTRSGVAPLSPSRYRHAISADGEYWMRKLLLTAGLLALAMGLLWIGQGTGTINWPRSSFMINELHWAGYGAALAAFGLVLIWQSTR